MIIYQLTRPFAYLKIKNHPVKVVFDWLIPLLATLAICWLMFPIWRDVDFYSKEGLISKLMSFCQTLPGFFLAALSVIATFNKADIDQLLPEPTPKVEIEVGGAMNVIDLTRRRFLCYLFAFLTVDSLILAILPIFVLSAAAAVPKDFEFSMASAIISGLFVAFYIFIFFQMLTATMLGMYYLGDKLHQPNI